MHIPQVVDLVPGILSGQLFVLSDTQLGGAVPDGPRRRLAIYQVEAGRVAEAVSGLATVIRDGSLDRWAASSTGTP